MHGTATTTPATPRTLPGVADSVLDLIGGTPLVRLHAAAAGTTAQVLVKLEGRNPGGSAKDRPALGLIRAAEASGALAPGQAVVESTSGNTGIGLALVGRVTGHPVVIVHGGAMSVEKRALLALYGAELIEADWTLGPDHPDNARAVADRVAAERGAWRSHQYDDPANPDAHHEHTGPELWRQTGGAITHLVAGIGTGGTISGAGRYLKEVSDGAVRVIGVDPEGSTYGGGTAGVIRVEGVGTTWPASHWPRNLDRSVPDEIRVVGHDRAIAAVRLLAAEGLLVGPSSGLALAAALDVAADLDERHVVVVMAPDGATNYLEELTR